MIAEAVGGVVINGVALATVLETVARLTLLAPVELSTIFPL